VTAFVLDSSVALCWCFENEATAETDELFRRARDEGAAVPNLWPVEVANVLVGAERSRRIDSTKLTEALLLLESIGLEIEADTSSRAFRELVQIAQVERLTTYDAAYLELARRRRLPLATKDRDLAAAARRHGVPLVLKA